MGLLEIRRIWNTDDFKIWLESLLTLMEKELIRVTKLEVIRLE